MKTGCNPESLTLAKNRSVSLTAARGASIRCHDGGVWITQDHDLRDIVLAPGQSFTFDRDGPALVSALEGSSVELRSVQPCGPAVQVH